MKNRIFFAIDMLCWWILYFIVNSSRFRNITHVEIEREMENSTTLLCVVFKIGILLKIKTNIYKTIHTRMNVSCLPFSIIVLYYSSFTVYNINIKSFYVNHNHIFGPTRH